MDSANRNINGNTETLANFMDHALEDINKAHLENTTKNQSFDDDFESSRTEATQKIASSILKISSEFLKETVANDKQYIKFTVKRKTISLKSDNLNQIKNLIKTYSLNEFNIFKLWLEAFSKNNKKELKLKYFSKKINSLIQDSLEIVKEGLTNINKNTSNHVINSETKSKNNKITRDVKLVLEITKRNETTKTIVLSKKNNLYIKIKEFDDALHTLAQINSDFMVEHTKARLDKLLNIKKFIKLDKNKRWDFDGETVHDLVKTINRFYLTKISPFDDFISMVKKKPKGKYDLYYLYNKIVSLADKIDEIIKPKLHNLMQNQNYRHFRIDYLLRHSSDYWRTSNDRYSYIDINIRKRNNFQ